MHRLPFVAVAARWSKLSNWTPPAPLRLAVVVAAVLALGLSVAEPAGEGLGSDTGAGDGESVGDGVSVGVGESVVGGGVLVVGGGVVVVGGVVVGDGVGASVIDGTEVEVGEGLVDLEVGDVLGFGVDGALSGSHCWLLTVTAAIVCAGSAAGWPAALR